MVPGKSPETGTRDGAFPMMHQASILFSFMVLVMGGVWLAMVELGGSDPAERSGPPPMVAMTDATVTSVSLHN